MSRLELNKKWHHDPCPYHERDEECPVCDDPVCACGNPGWACDCDFRPELAELPYNWVPVQQDTDCAGCHYTIRAHDQEGMFQAPDGKLYCMTSCYAEC